MVFTRASAGGALVGARMGALSRCGLSADPALAHPAASRRASSGAASAGVVRAMPHPPANRASAAMSSASWGRDRLMVTKRSMAFATTA